MSLLICPHCGENLFKTKSKSYCCSANHSFDLSKEGYLNLLPVSDKKSKDPGDNALMIAARRNFLETGLYTPLIKSIREIIEKDLHLVNQRFVALDSGCGEGYYSQEAIKKVSTKAEVVGTDISKYAVKNASKKYKENFYFVSSVYRLPILSKSIDIILSVFSPNHAEEFTRILKNEGYLIIVSPAEQHMKQLADLIYNNFRPHEHKIVTQMGNQFRLHLAKRVSFEIDINSTETLLNLHKMTPYYYNTSRDAQEKIAGCTSLKVQCDFHISVFKLPCD